MKKIVALIVILLLPATSAYAQEFDYRSQCALTQSVVINVQGELQMDNGGIFKPSRTWSAVVDRAGVLCSVAKAGDAWPDSRAIAVAKASTANDFSNSATRIPK